MDLDKYIEQLQQNLQTHLDNLGATEITHSYTQNRKRCPFCGESLLPDADFCPYCGNELEKMVEKDDKIETRQPIYKLHRYDELEEETKAKIGTCEKIYQQIYQQDTGRAMIASYSSRKSYDQLDFAALITLLGSAVEIELNASVLPFMRMEYGANYKFTYRGQDFDLSQNKQTLACLYAYLSYDINRHKRIEKYGIKVDRVQRTLDILEKVIVKFRNKAAHIEVISDKQFFKFYESVYTLFEEYVKDLITLKKNVRTSSKSFGAEKRTFKEPTYATTIGTSNPNQEDREEQGASPLINKRGVIFTNTQLLAHKFFDQDYVMGDNGERVKSSLVVRDTIEIYINFMSMVGTQYVLLDLGEADNISNLHTWQDYAKMLNLSVSAAFGEISEPIGLFIIGGDDVIPMPRVENPIDSEESVSERTVDSDMLYAYYRDDVKELTFSDNKVDISVLVKHTPRYWVGRLPLENGLVDGDFSQFKDYFVRAVNEYIHYNSEENTAYLGIAIKKHIATAMASTELATKRMIEGIPLAPQENRIGFINDHIFLSPSLDLRKEGSKTEDYKQEVEEADMLTLFLHGASRPSGYCFYGETKDGIQNGFYGFMPELFENSNIKVVSGVCCWGARYIGFSREQSALLRAMYSNALLFCGASRSAYGPFDPFLESGSDIFLSVVLLRYYLNYLMQGYNAGEALGRAKLLQMTYPEFSDLAYTMYTLLEFNLFGDPLLSLIPQLERRPIEIIGPQKKFDGKFSVDNYAGKMVYSKQRDEKLSLLDRLRNKVDKNLQEIREKVNEQLYSEFNVEPRTLKTIHSYQSITGAKEFRFAYVKEGELYDSITLVQTDELGNIKSIAGSY